LERYGFGKWHRLIDIKKGVIKCPKNIETGAVYIIRLNRKFGRLKGESDILYIGSTGDLHDRIVENFLRGRGGKTTKRIHDYLVHKGYLNVAEVSWVFSENYEELEDKLLKVYEEDHHELPPWNRARRRDVRG